MKDLIEKIKFFHGLKLQPVKQKECKIWEAVIKKKLISEHNVKECYVRIHVLTRGEIESLKTVKIVRKSRLRKKKNCCEMCEKS